MKLQRLGGEVQKGIDEVEGLRAGLTGAARLAAIQEWKSKAEMEAKSAHREASAAVQEVLDSLAVATLPALDAKRELLSRQDLSTALNSPRGTLLSRVQRVAERGGEAAAALHSEYGRTLLESIAETPQEVEEALAVARGVALAKAKQDGSPIGKAAVTFEANASGALAGADTYYRLITKAR
jgi:hypothetical protein